MASFKVKLFINDEERNVLNLDQSFRQVVDITGKPEGKPYGEPLFLSLESTIDDSFFYHHAFSSSSMISGELVFYKRDGFSILYKLEFANAHILGLTEEFDAYGEYPLHFNLKIGWSIVRINGVVFKEDWSLDDPYAPEVEATVIEEELEPRVIDFYTTDTNENRITQYSIGDIIYVNIESENKIGDTITINLADKTKDFKYSGDILENDSMDYEIKSNNDKIELEVIKQH